MVPATGGKAVGAESSASQISTENGDHSADARTSDTEEDTGDQLGLGIGNVKPDDISNTSDAKPPSGSTHSTRSAFDIILAKLTPARAAFVLFTMLALWLSADELRRALWTFCVIAVAYISLWTIYLSVEISARTVLVSVSYVALVANAIANLSSKAGIFIMLLDTAYAAGLFGYALAEYRQDKGFEQSAKSVLESDRARSEEELKFDKNVITMVTFYSMVISLMCTVGAVWMIYYAVDMYWFIVVQSLLIDLSLFSWTCLVGVHLLHCAIVVDDCMTFVYWGALFLILPDLFLSYLMCQTIGMLVHPLGVMGIAALLGYNLCVYARYSHMVTP